MRTAVASSVVFHMAFIAAAYRLPPAPAKRFASVVTLEVQGPKPLPEPPAQIPAPVRAAPVEPRLALSTTRREREERPEERFRPEPKRPEPDVPAPIDTSPKPPVRSGPVDLTLHALPFSKGGVALPEGSGTTGTIGSAPRKEWRPRGDAGDPITGKIKEKPTERFPLTPIGGGEYAYSGPSFSAHIAADGQVSFDNKTLRDFKGLSGGYDLTDLIMRGKGEDPYRHEKREFLLATEEMRTKMAKSALRDRQRASLAALPAHLATLWASGRPAAERRQLLYALWKEASGSEAELADAAREARAIVEAFVRRQLPADSPDAFSDDELASYNRGAKLRFEPYR